MCDQLTSEIAVLDEALKASEEDITKLQTKLREARSRQNSIVARLESANNRARVREMYNGSKMTDAFSRFDILERRVDYAEGRAEAAGLEVVGPTHHGVFKSVYFFDPNGHRLELAWQFGTADQMRSLRDVADDMLEEWARTRKAPRHAAWLHEKIAAES